MCEQGLNSSMGTSLAPEAVFCVVLPAVRRTGYALLLFMHSGLGADQGLLDQGQQSATSAVLTWPPTHARGL